jgi:hypothetical protein
MIHQRVALTLLMTDAAGFMPTPICWANKKRQYDTYPYEQSKVPRLLATNHPPEEEYDQFSSSRTNREEVVAYTHVSAEGPSVHPDVNSRAKRPLDTSGSDTLLVETLNKQLLVPRQGRQDTNSLNTQLDSVPGANQNLTGQAGVSTPRPSIISSNLPLESPASQSSMESVYQGEASVARLDNLEKILPPYLLECMETSLIRRLEENRENMGPIRLTSAVVLYIVAQRDRDFKLKIALGSSTGKVILQSLTELESVEDLRSLLGKCLFDGMKSSNYRKEEEKRGITTSTSTVRVFSPSGMDSSVDCMLEVMLDYNTGLRIWHDVF